MLSLPPSSPAAHTVTITATPSPAPAASQDPFVLLGPAIIAAIAVLLGALVTGAMTMLAQERLARKQRAEARRDALRERLVEGLTGARNVAPPLLRYARSPEGEDASQILSDFVEGVNNLNTVSLLVADEGIKESLAKVRKSSICVMSEFPEMVNAYARQAAETEQKKQIAKLQSACQNYAQSLAQVERKAQELLAVPIEPEGRHKTPRRTLRGR